MSTIVISVSGMPDLGSAIAAATGKAMARRYTHATVAGYQKLGANSWQITLDVAQGPPTMQRAESRDIIAGWHDVDAVLKHHHDHGCAGCNHLHRD